MHVPIIQPSQATALQPYQFSAPTQNRIISVSIHSFAYMVRGEQYRSFQDFKSDFDKYFGVFRDEYTQLDGLTRIGLRYVNHLPLERDSLGFIIKTPLLLPKLSDKPQRNLALVSESLEGLGLLRIYVNSNEPLPSPQQWPHDRILLDFDYSFEGSMYQSIPLERLDEYTQEAHDVTKNVLRKIVDSKYLEEVGIL